MHVFFCFFFVEYGKDGSLDVRSLPQAVFTCKDCAIYWTTTYSIRHWKIHLAKFEEACAWQICLYWQCIWIWTKWDTKTDGLIYEQDLYSSLLPREILI